MSIISNVYHYGVIDVLCGKWFFIGLYHMWHCLMIVYHTFIALFPNNQGVGIGLFIILLLITSSFTFGASVIYIGLFVGQLYLYLFVIVLLAHLCGIEVYT